MNPKLIMFILKLIIPIAIVILMIIITKTILWDSILVTNRKRSKKTFGTFLIRVSLVSVIIGLIMMIYLVILIILWLVK